MVSSRVNLVGNYGLLFIFGQNIVILERLVDSLFSLDLSATKAVWGFAKAI